MDCMQTGVPTLTTSTLTPTTLRSIEESFIQYTSEPINAPYQAGFIPPPLGAYNSSVSNNPQNANSNSNSLPNVSNTDNVSMGLSSNAASMLVTASSAATSANSSLQLQHQQQQQQQKQNLSNMYLGDLSGGGSLNDYSQMNDSETENSQESWNAAQLNEENSLATTDTCKLSRSLSHEILKIKDNN